MKFLKKKEVFLGYMDELWPSMEYEDVKAGLDTLLEEWKPKGYSIMSGKGQPNEIWAVLDE